MLHIFLLTTYVTYVSLNPVMADTEQNTSKVQVGANIDPDIFEVIDRFRSEEDRSLSNMIERLLKTHPRVAAELGAEPAAVSAN